MATYLNLSLGEIAERVRAKIGLKPMTVFTNASLLNREGVRKNLAQFDLAIAKLDVVEDESLRVINRPADRN